MMDVFPSTKSTNIKRIKLGEFFGKVGHLILDSDQVGRLPVLMNWLLRLLVCELLTVALTAAGLVVYWFISTTVLKQYTVYKCREDKNDDFKKFKKLDDVDIEQVSSEKRKPRISSTPLRKLTLLLSLNMWHVAVSPPRHHPHSPRQHKRDEREQSDTDFNWR